MSAALASVARLAAGLAICAALAAPASAAPSALTVGPDDTHLLVALRPMGGLERQVDRLQAYLKATGLGDPGFDALRALVLDAVSPAGKRKGPAQSVVRTMGLNPDGAVAFYLVSIGDGEREVMALDVADFETFVKVAAHLLEKEQWVEPGVAPKKARVVRGRGADGAQEVTITIDAWSRLALRHKNGVAVLASQPEALVAMRLDGGRAFDVADRLRTGPDQVAFLVAMEPSRSAQTMRSPEAWFATVDRLAFTGHWGPEGLEAWGEAEFAPDVAEVLGYARPGPAGARARAQMATLVDRHSSAWFRYGVDVQGIWKAFEAIAGGQIGEIEAEFQRETGIALRRELVDQVTGDVLFTAREGIADFVGVLGVVDSAKAAATLAKWLDRVGQDLGPRSHLKTEWAQSGDHRLYRTRAWDGDAKREDVRDEFVFYWGTRDSGLVFGLTPHAVEASLAPRSDAFAGERLLEGKAFAANVPLVTNQVYREPFNLARQFLPVVRALMPAEQANPTGRIVRGIEAFQALYDRVVDASTFFEIDGRTVRLRSRVRALPTPASPEWNAQADEAYTDGLRARYQGLVRSSNERLLAVSERFPGTPWADKARAYALGGDAGSNLLFLLPSLGALSFLAESGRDAPDGGAVPAYDPCDDLASRACWGDEADAQLCRVARAGVPGDCAAALAGSLP